MMIAAIGRGYTGEARCRSDQEPSLTIRSVRHITTCCPVLTP